MVEAILDGRKTQTRRSIETTSQDLASGQVLIFEGPRFGGTVYRFEPRYSVGDRLYVREGYYQCGHWEQIPNLLTKGGKPKWKFVADDDQIKFSPQGSFRRAMPTNLDERAEPWLYKRLGRFMPRSASRITLIVSEVRIERLQACSSSDAIAEGIKRYGRFYGLPETDWDHAELSAVSAYHRLWNSINGEGAWEANPWVVAVSFDARKGNIDGR